MPEAEILSIGTEILLGEIVDTNAQVIARSLRKIGVDVYRTTVVGDNRTRIARIIQESLQRAEIVISTGGIGPTVDDYTREAIADALNLESIYQPVLWEVIAARFKKYGSQPTDNNKRQAYLPRGAEALPNPRGTAPGVFVSTDQGDVFALPGVPEEMSRMLDEEVIPRIKARYQLQGTILTRTILTRGVGESRVDTLLQDLEKLSNPTVGLAAKKGQVGVRITAKGENLAAARALLSPLEKEIQQRLAEWIVEEEKSAE